MEQEINYRCLIGRNRTGSEPGGTRIHAIYRSESAFGTAICGAQPGRRSNGWSDYEFACATCPKCMKKLKKKVTP
jgi:hypothetical protein